MKDNILKKVIDETSGSLNDLRLGLTLFKRSDPEKKNYSLYFDGIVKKFENLFAKSTNLLRLALIQEGIQTMSPRQALQESVRLNWITDVDFWLLALDAKSSSMNGISDISKSEYINIINQFATEVEVIINLLTELRTIERIESRDENIEDLEDIVED